MYCDLKNASHKQYLFTIFHRLNTTGIKLNNQEIRNAIYQGTLNDLLNNCNENVNWVNILKIDKSKQYRFSKQELILRFFAFYDLAETYKIPLTRFLNNYMNKHQKASTKFVTDKQILFDRTIKVIDEKLSILEKDSNVVIESLLVGCAQNIDFIENLSDLDFKNRFSALLSHTAFAPNNMQSGLYQQDKLAARLAAATLYFSSNFQLPI